MQEGFGIIERLQTIISSGWGFAALEALVIAWLFQRIWSLWEARLQDRVKDADKSTSVFKEVADALKEIASKTERPRR